MHGFPRTGRHLNVRMVVFCSFVFLKNKLVTNTHLEVLLFFSIKNNKLITYFKVIRLKKPVLEGCILGSLRITKKGLLRSEVKWEGTEAVKRAQRAYGLYSKLGGFRVFEGSNPSPPTARRQVGRDPCIWGSSPIQRRVIKFPAQNCSALKNVSIIRYTSKRLLSGNQKWFLLFSITTRKYSSLFQT